MAKHVDYYFSLNSPWSYLGAGRLEQLLAAHGASVSAYPVDFGRIFPESGGLPLPKRAPQRQAYRLMELARWRDWLKQPLVLQPKAFPSPEGERLRMVLAARRAHGHEAAMRLAHAFMAALWADDLDINDPAVLDAAAGRSGFDGPALRRDGADPALAAEYDADTAAALKRGVFGAPTYVIDDELFWGQDRLDFVARKLAA
ncbi:MAG: 2-hydroxychromene-2-carboxylate isomerase [Alphaproteobacteria bacterium]